MTKAPTAEALTETLNHAIAIAPQLVNDAAWIWIDAYWPPKPDRDRPSRAPRPSDGPDHMPGERLALGVGNDRARAAYTTSALHVVNAHRLAGVAIARWTGRRPPLPRRRPARGHEYKPLVDASVRRLRWLLAPERDLAHTNDQTRLAVHAAADALIEAHAALRAVLKDVDSRGGPGADRRCKNCSDPIEPGRRGFECGKCARYRQRTGRPRLIRRHEDARRARDRRRERQEDRGANPPPWGSYRDGEWVPAEPYPDPPAWEAS